MEKINISTDLLVSKVEHNLRDYNSSLSNLLYEIIPVIKQLVDERNDRLELTEPTTDSGMAVAKLQDTIDELEELYQSHEERIDDLMSDIESVERRLDDAEVTITI